jgi:hypothetical protein
MIRIAFDSFALAITALALTACNAGPLLKTGSLTSAPVAAAPKPSTPVDRALHVAATSARAHKCGFYFNAPALRTNFLAAEAALAPASSELTKIGQSYDFTALKITQSIKSSEAYCSKSRTASIKKSLQAALAGNFEPPPKKVAKTASGGLGSLLDSDAAPEKFDKDHIFDPILNPKKKPGAE